MNQCSDCSYFRQGTLNTESLESPRKQKSPGQATDVLATSGGLSGPVHPPVPCPVGYPSRIKLGVPELSKTKNPKARGFDFTIVGYRSGLQPMLKAADLDLEPAWNRVLAPADRRIPHGLSRLARRCWRALRIPKKERNRDTQRIEIGTCSAPTHMI
jgi:hypothetical protein